LTPELGPLRSEPLERGDQLWREGRRDDALGAYTEELNRSAADHFTRGMAHKRVVTLLAERDGIDAAFARYELERVDDRDLTIAPGEVLLCATVQDEAERLPFFLDYYERLGVDRFLFVDNDSHDATRAALLERPNVHVWASAMRYWRANYGMAWIDVILYAHGRGHWCVIVDTDEHLWYPGVEQRDLHALCATLDQEGAVAMQAVLLDMYSETSIRDASCPPGRDPASVCGYFDRKFSHTHTEHATPWSNIDAFWGGVRRRVFGKESDVFLSKVPLVRYSDDTVVLAGTHGTAVPPDAVASERGALLHFKFTSRFVERPRGGDPFACGMGRAGRVVFDVRAHDCHRTRSDAVRPASVGRAARQHATRRSRGHARGEPQRRRQLRVRGRGRRLRRAYARGGPGLVHRSRRVAVSCR
jgi:Glycosyl transferase family 2